jgi:EAL domain-containing protein (putative c-di-GMP-specific phosphodiesterase class I)
MRVVAEGVETAEALKTMSAMGCDVAQGYYLSRPLPADELD